VKIHTTAPEIVLTERNRSEIVEILATYFNDSDFYHVAFLIKSKLIGESYDHSDFLILNPIYFKLKAEHLKILDESELKLTENFKDL